MTLKTGLIYQKVVRRHFRGVVEFLMTTLLQFARPKISNSLPPALRMCTIPDTFRRHLKTHCFQQPSNPLNAFLLAPLIRLLLTIMRVYKLHLLTFLLTAYDFQ